MASIGSEALGDSNDRVTDLLKNLNLTTEEEEVVQFSDDEQEVDPTVEWELLGKVLSPTIVHAQAIQGAMRPAWGNPTGLKIRMIGRKEDNLFVAEFGFKQDMERALGGSPWLVGKHAVIMREYDESLKPSEIHFDRMDVWVRIMDLPLGWMNKSRGERVMGLIGSVKKMDVDKEGKANGPFLRARVAIEVTKPVRRGVLVKTKRDSDPEWFDLQYEKLPYYCSSCGVMGHSHLECDKPLIRNEDGKLPYDVKLRVYDPKKKKLQSFADAATETFGSASSSSSKQPRGSANLSGERNRSAGIHDDLNREEEGEVSSPLKQPEPRQEREKEVTGARETASRQLFKAGVADHVRVPRKRKSKNVSINSAQTSDLNLPIIDPLAVVPTAVAEPGFESRVFLSNRKRSSKEKNYSPLFII
jgi:hypothetical protein